MRDALMWAAGLARIDREGSTAQPIPVENSPLSPAIDSHHGAAGANGGFSSIWLLPLAVQGIEVFRRRLLNESIHKCASSAGPRWDLATEFRPPFFCGGCLLPKRARSISTHGNNMLAIRGERGAVDQAGVAFQFFY